MDQETLKLLAKVKVVARKAMGLDIDIHRLTHDRHYAAEVLGRAAHADNEDLVLAALTLQVRFGLLTDSPEPRLEAHPVAAANEKYKFGARG